MVENAFGILVSHFRVLPGTMEPRPRVVRDIVFMYVVCTTCCGHTNLGQTGHQPQQMLLGPNKMNRWCMYQVRTTGILSGRPNIIQNTERLLQSRGVIGWAGGQDLRCANQQSWGQKLASISPFQDHPIIPRTFI